MARVKTRYHSAQMPVCLCRNGEAFLRCPLCFAFNLQVCGRSRPELLGDSVP